MANHSGLKKVVKTVHTKKGTKRQTFWVKASPKASEKPKRKSGPSGKDYAHVAGALGAIALGMYGAHKLHKMGMEHMGKALHAGRASGAPASAPKKHSAYDEFMAQPGVVNVDKHRGFDNFMRQPGVHRVGR